MRFTIALNFLALAFVFTSCTKNSNKSDLNNGKAPTTSEEALSKLSPEHKAKFEAWKTQTFKSCSSSEVLGKNQKDIIESKGIDGIALLKQNHESVVFKDAENIAVLSEFNSFSGVSESKSEETQNINGSNYSVSVETKRIGSICSVYFYGQKVYETSFFQSAVIGSHFSKLILNSISSLPPKFSSIGIHGSVEADANSLSSLVSQNLQVTNASQIFLAKQLSLNNEEAMKFFKIGNTNSSMIWQLEGNESFVWTKIREGILISSTLNVEDFFNGNGTIMPIELRHEIPKFNFKGIMNTADNGNLKFRLMFSITKNENLFTASLLKFNQEGFIPYSQQEAETCAKERFQAYHGSLNLKEGISPSIPVLFDTCRVLFPDILKVSYENQFLKSLISIVFENVTPSRQILYGGWDLVLNNISKEIFFSKKDLNLELDPNGKTIIIKVIARHLQAVNFEIEKSINMQPLLESAIQMAFSWSFQGSIVPENMIADFIRSLDNAADVYKVSVVQLMNDLAVNPSNYRDQLVRASSFDQPFKAESLKALSLSKELAYNDFETDIFNQIIQKNITIEDLKVWINNLNIIKIELNKHPNLNPLKGELTKASVQWLQKSELDSQGIADVLLAINNSIDPFIESTKKLVSDLGQSITLNKESLEYAKSISNEHRKIAIAIRDNSKIAGYEDWGIRFFNSLLQTKPNYQQLRRWDNLWSSILSFIQREKVRIGSDSGFTPERNRKEVLAVAIKEEWSASEFESFENISEIAKGKSSCDYYKDSSSIANCAGLGLFSNGPNKFFDTKYNNRYNILSIEFKKFLKQLTPNDWTTLRWSLVGSFFGTWEPIWSKCDNGAFAQKTTELRTQVSQITLENNQFKKWELERKIKETLENCKN